MKQPLAAHPAIKSVLISCCGLANKGPVVQVGKGLPQFLPRVHHDRPTPGNGFPQRPDGEKHKAYAFLSRPDGKFIAFAKEDRPVV
jgi:hypothetical protein